MVLNYFVDDTSAESSSFFCSCIDSLVLMAVKKNYSIKQAHDSGVTWGVNILNKNDILKPLFCLSPSIVGGSPVTEAEHKCFHVNFYYLCQSQTNAALAVTRRASNFQ